MGAKYKQIEECGYFLKEQFQADRAIKSKTTYRVTQIQKKPTERRNVRGGTWGWAKRSRWFHRTTERERGNLRLSEAKPMVPQNDGTWEGEPEAERSEADGSTERRNVATSMKKNSKILNNSENISQHLPLGETFPPRAEGTGKRSLSIY